MSSDLLDICPTVRWRSCSGAKLPTHAGGFEGVGRREGRGRRCDKSTVVSHKAIGTWVRRSSVEEKERTSRSDAGERSRS